MGRLPSRSSLSLVAFLWLFSRSLLGYSLSRLLKHVCSIISSMFLLLLILAQTGTCFMTSQGFRGVCVCALFVVCPLEGAMSQCLPSSPVSFWLLVCCATLAVNTATYRKKHWYGGIISRLTIFFWLCCASLNSRTSLLLSYHSILANKIPFDAVP